MATTYRSTAHTGYLGGPDVQITIAKPAGLAVDDILVAVLHLESATAKTPTSAGFTLVQEGYTSSGGGPLGIAVLWKRATSSDIISTDFTFSWTGGVWSTGDLHAFSGSLGTGTPLTGNVITTSGVSNTIPSVSYTAGDGLGVWAFTEYVDGGTVTKPTGYTLRSNQPDGDLTLATRSDTSGATSSGTGTTSGNDLKVTFVATILDNSSPSLPSGLISEYSFNEGSGTFAGDDSGNNYNITVDSTKWTVNGHTGNAVIGPDVTGNVALGPSSLPARTVMCWAKMPATIPGASLPIIVSMTNFEALYIDGSTTKAISRYDQTNGLDITGMTALSAGTWYHLAWSTGPAGLKMYVNGVLDGSDATTVSYGLASTRLCNDGAGTLTFTGIVDEIRVYDNQLSAAQITVMMNMPLAGTPTPLMWVI